MLQLGRFVLFHPPFSSSKDETKWMSSDNSYRFHGNHSFPLPTGKVVSEEPERQQLCHPKKSEMWTCVSFRKSKTY